MKKFKPYRTLSPIMRLHHHEFKATNIEDAIISRDSIELLVSIIHDDRSLRRVKEPVTVNIFFGEHVTNGILKDTTFKEVVDNFAGILSDLRAIFDSNQYWVHHSEREDFVDKLYRLLMKTQKVNTPNGVTTATVLEFIVAIHTNPQLVLDKKALSKYPLACIFKDHFLRPNNKRLHLAADSTFNYYVRGACLLNLIFEWIPLFHIKPYGLSVYTVEED